MKGLLEDKKTLKLVALVGVLLAAIIAFLGWYVRPLADDFVSLHVMSSMNPVAAVERHLTHTTGRFGNAVVLTLLIKLFGDWSMNVTPLIMILLLIGSCYYLLTYFKITKQNALFVALVFAPIFLLSMPSLNDSVYWMSATTEYTLNVIGVFFVFGAVLRLWTRETKLLHWKAALIVLAMFVIGGLAEMAPLINVAIILCVCLAWQGRQYDGRNLMFGILVAMQALALAILLLAPGSIQRQHHSGVGGMTLLGSIGPSVGFAWKAVSSFSAAQDIIMVLLSAAVVLVVARIADVQHSKEITRKVWALLVVAVVLFVVPIGLATYGQISYEFDRVPYRIQTYTVASIVLLLSLLFWFLFGRFRMQISHPKANAALLVVVVAAVALSVVRLGTFGSALTQRAFASDQRMVEARIQIEQGKTTIYLPQVPLYATSDAHDLPSDGDSSYMAKFILGTASAYLGVGKVVTDNYVTLGQCPLDLNQNYTNNDYCGKLYWAIQQVN